MSTTTGLSSEITMESFLTLFTTQLQYQDPLDPQDNSEFLSQLAQFTALEQEQQQTEYLSDLSSIDTASLQLDQIGVASEFIGSTITYSDDTGEGEYTGVVEGVKLEEDGTVSFVIDGESVSISNFIKVENSGSATTEDTTPDTSAGVLDTDTDTTATDTTEDTTIAEL
ncbi:MAG: hypothetical protein FJ264_04820 [Planctomycetes bacterium]|nr:hypothetical protein [Planctomycetota bacterium]